MADSHPVRFWPACLALVWLAPSSASACDVPVFRYALERWTPDRFAVVVFHRDPFTPQQRLLVETLERAAKDSSANLVVRSVDVSSPIPAPFQKLWQTQSASRLPWMVVRYPARTGLESAIWAGPLETNVVATLADSPVRREVVRRLWRGDTAVWLLVESGDHNRDDTLQQGIESQSRNLERCLELPMPSSDDPPMLLDLPLKVRFSILEVSRSDPNEHVLLNQLLNWDTRLRSSSEPILFAVFGRGRVLPPAVGSAIRPEVIATMARMLTGPCSCQIKEMNAGYDLLLTANWNALLESHRGKEPEPPPLAGLTSLVGSSAGRLPDPPLPVTVHATVTAAVPLPLHREPLFRNLAVVFGGALSFLIVTALFLRRKIGGSERSFSRATSPAAKPSAPAEQG